MGTTAAAVAAAGAVTAILEDAVRVFVVAAAVAVPVAGLLTGLAAARSDFETGVAWGLRPLAAARRELAAAGFAGDGKVAESVRCASVVAAAGCATATAVRCAGAAAETGGGGSGSGGRGRPGYGSAGPDQPALAGDPRRPGTRP